MPDASAPIGVFDSGIGGLTVLAAIQARLPKESTVYLGDTARVPYGTKSRETVRRYAWSCTRILLDRGIKALVVACNTASAFALADLAAQLPIPVLGVIEPGAYAAARATRNGHVGVIGTKGTVGSGAYPAAIEAHRPGTSTYMQACPLLVPLAEEGWVDGPIATAAIQAYLEPLLREQIDTLVLGCTHYPLLRNAIAAAVSKAVVVVDSAHESAASLATLLAQADLLSTSESAAHAVLVTDEPDGFAQLGSRFLGHELPAPQWVEL